MDSVAPDRENDFFLNYELPPELIAQHPVEPRDSSRLLVVDRARESLADHLFADLSDILSSGDLLVINDSRVIPARLFCRRASGGMVELLLLERTQDDCWTALARPLGRLQPGESLDVLDRNMKPTNDVVQFRHRRGNLAIVKSIDPAIIDRYGLAPLPPYIHESLDDAERYQTVYSERAGSAAAPTAGLHFTPELLDRCRANGIQIAPVTLHVGLDTFKPLETDNLSEHAMHSEWYDVSESSTAAIRAARLDGRRIVSVGTTSTRVLETIAASQLEGRIVGRTSIFIHPPYDYELVGAQITNFHLPRTTLLLMIGAFAGTSLLRRAYEHAIAQRYRFYSFGDAMLIV